MAVFEVNPTELIIKISEKLKEIKAIEPPKWATFVKTSHGKDRPPVQTDWWFIRTASILRKVMIRGPVGVNKLRVLYGNKKNNGMAPSHFVKGSGNIIRKILQQLEKAELIKKAEKDTYKGKITTAKGISLLDKTAAEILKENPPKKIEIPKIQIKTEEKENKEVKKTEKKGIEKPKEEVKVEKKEEVNKETEKPKEDSEKENSKSKNES